MDIKDFLRALKTGWLPVVLITVLSLGIAWGYLLLTPKRFETTTSIYISASSATSVDDLDRASNFANRAVTTFANITDSVAVLAPVAQTLNLPVEELQGNVTTSIPEQTSLVDVRVSGPSGDYVARVADAVAIEASRVLPTFETAPNGLSLLRAQPTRSATTPSEPVSPNGKRTLAIAMFLGLVFGAAFTTARQALDSRVRTSSDLQRLSDAPILVQIPTDVGASRRATLIARDEPSSLSSEAFRTLRTNLGFTDSWARKTIVFASASGVDASDVTSNLAWTLAQAGYSVALVDANLRNPSISAYFGVTNSPGLIDILQEGVDVSLCAREILRSKLHLIPAGESPAGSNPADVLSLPSVSKNLSTLEQNYDYVIVSAPPLSNHADTAILSAMAAATVLVATVGRTRQDDVVSALESLRIVRVKPIGIVLRDVKSASGGTPRRVELRESEQPLRRQETGVATSREQESLETPTLRQGPVHPTPFRRDPSEPASNGLRRSTDQRPTGLT